MKGAGCDVLVTVAIPRFGALAVREVAELGWKPLHILNGVASSVGAALKPAGLENAKGIISDNSFKDPTDPQWQNDAGYKTWVSFMDKYYASGDKTDNQSVYGQSIAATTVQVLKQCGDEIDPRERDEAGGQPATSRTADAVARHHDQYKPDQFRADQAGPAAAFRWRALRSIRSDPKRRGRLILGKAGQGATGRLSNSRPVVSPYL